MRDAYHEDLEALTTTLVDMTRLVGGAVSRATQAVLDADLSLAEAVIDGDDAIDAAYNDIEKRAYDLLARQQPVAADLRLIVASLRMMVDLERAGDYARHIAELARRRYPASAIPADLRPTVLEMGQVTARIVEKCGRIVAGIDRGDLVDKVEQLEREDDVIDNLHRELFTVLLSDDWDGGIETAVDVILCGRYYERLADHVVGVARRVVYLVTGERHETPLA
jgi:phosphate transport system protein